MTGVPYGCMMRSRGTLGGSQISQSSDFRVQATAQGAPKKTKLSGAAKRRRAMERRAAIAAGSSIVEPGNKIREACVESNVADSDAERLKIDVRTPPAIRMAIIHYNHPDQKLEPSSQDAIHGLLWRKLEHTADPLPRINVGTMVRGALHVTCEGPRAANWLRNIEGRTAGGVKLRVVEAKDILLRPIKMAWRCKNISGINVFKLLKMLQRLHPKLHTEEWKVVDSDVEPTGTRTIVLMDRASAEVIKEAGYCLHTGLCSSYFKLLDDTGKKRPTEDVQPSTSSAPQVVVEDRKERDSYFEGAGVFESTTSSYHVDRDSSSEEDEDELTTEGIFWYAN